MTQEGNETARSQKEAATEGRKTKAKEEAVGVPENELQVQNTSQSKPARGRKRANDAIEDDGCTNPEAPEPKRRTMCVRANDAVEGASTAGPLLDARMAEAVPKKPAVLARESYTVGWVCALPKEQTVAIAMLDQRHSDLPKPANDPNAYTLGSVGKHNVVIACLPKGQIGTSPAATVAAHMISTFPSIKVGLMVGIGGGIPPKVRLGDVVVSIPVGVFPGVVQWDLGKAAEGGNFGRTGALNNPPTSLLTALTKLQTEHELVGSKIPEYLEEMKEKWPRLAPKYLKSDALEDVLFRADCPHISENTTDYEATSDVDEDEEEGCRSCDKTQTVKRKPRDMKVHYGLIASGNQVIKDAAFRNQLNRDLGGKVICVEMEAAGLMNNFPCIVIRGICDYADSHKNKAWQEHAAAIAAAFAKELLGCVQPNDVDGESTAKDILNQG